MRHRGRAGGARQAPVIPGEARNRQVFSMTLVGGIEAGGTKFVCAVGTGASDLRATARIPTTTPEETLARCVAFFQEQPEPVAAIGIACFGPIDLRPTSPTYGHITTTPKVAWRNVDIRGSVARALGVPVAFDTDVNGAAMGEQRWGAAQGLANVLYVTVGTGIGGGVIVHGQPLHGLVHPELGHIPVPHDRAKDPFAGVCPAHGDCLEGLASGPAIAQRWGVSGDEMPRDHPAWILEAEYLAQGISAWICTLSPERIVLGGGVMEQTQLFPSIRQRVRELLNGYIAAPEVGERIDEYIVPAALGSSAGVVGAIALAQHSYT
jgi:fructokinase